MGGHAFLVSMSFAIYIKIFIYLYANKDYIRSNEYSICESFKNNGSCCGNGLEKYSCDLDLYTTTTTNFIIRRSKANKINWWAHSVLCELG